jgi:hypothetical protein
MRPIAGILLIVAILITLGVWGYLSYYSQPRRFIDEGWNGPMLCDPTDNPSDSCVIPSQTH